MASKDKKLKMFTGKEGYIQHETKSPYKRREINLSSSFSNNHISYTSKSKPNTRKHKPNKPNQKHTDNKIQRQDLVHDTPQLSGENHSQQCWQPVFSLVKQ
jgi:hypothetical protein